MSEPINRSYNSDPFTSREQKDIANARSRAVKQAWKQEQAYVKDGLGTRDWTPEQQKEILNKGSLTGYEGHHMRSVSNGITYDEQLKIAEDKNNIQFLEKSKENNEHIRAHDGDTRNRTNGYYNVKTGQTIDFGNNPPEPPKAEKLSSPIMGNNATNEQSSASNSIPKINSQTVASEGGGSQAPPVSNNETETTKRGHKPDPTENNEQHKEPIKRGKKEQEPVQNNGNEAANTQKRGFTPSNENGDAIKTVNPATEQSSKVAEEASKQAAEHAGRETAKTAALGV